MFLSIKSCFKLYLAALVVIVAAWIAGTMLVEVELDGEVTQEEALVPGSPASTLSDAFRALPSAGMAESKLELLDDNPEAWSARWRLLAEARDTIDVSYFILDADIFGISFLGHLLHKANSGVQVRILLDAIGTSLSREIDGNDYLDALTASQNVTIKVYRPYPSRLRDAFLMLNPLAILPSDHDKILIADGRRALIGGRNIAQEYLADPLDYPLAFRDADVLLTGKGIGSALGTVFQAGFASAKAQDLKREALDIKDSAKDLSLAYQAMDAWLRGTALPEQTSREIDERALPWLEDLAKLPRLRGTFKKNSSLPVPAEIRLFDSRPRLLRFDDAISRSLARLVNAARKEIFIEVPYVILSSRTVALLEKASARGVHITILTNSPVSTDNPLSQAFFLEQWPELLARLPTLRLFVAGDRHNIHAKLAAIDGQLALIGTYNLDPLSMSLNGELIAAAWSKDVAAQLLTMPKRLIAGGAPTVFEYRIVRNKNGRPRRGSDGKITIEFGPEDHSSPGDWKRVQLYRKLVRFAAKLPGTSELLWQSEVQDEHARKQRDTAQTAGDYQ